MVSFDPCRSRRMLSRKGEFTVPRELQYLIRVCRNRAAPGPKESNLSRKNSVVASKNVSVRPKPSSPTITSSANSGGGSKKARRAPDVPGGINE